MKKIILFAILGLILSTACKKYKKYENTWESLSTNEKEPEWLKDAKFGIYFHWGLYSVPAFGNEWYPRWMYLTQGKRKGYYEYHLKNYGSPKDFNYHNFAPMFKAEYFDAKEWVDLFKKSGAKFAGPVAQHHDGFAMWDSKVNPWNSKDMGPKKDILGLLFKELKKNDIKTIATFHHAKLLQRYAKDTTNWGKAENGSDPGRNSHFPYHPDYATSSTDPKLRLLYGNIPKEEFHEYWLNQVKEVVDNYRPDIIWFDSWLNQIPEEYRIEMVAHQFNTGVRRGQKPLVAYKQEDIPSNVGLLDIEQGGKTEISEDYWMTDITISKKSWCYIKNQEYKTDTLIIRNMIDVWSKKGVVLLNISPKSNGIINDEQKQILTSIGKWIHKHEEAVYGTRAYSIHGYGAAEFKKGHFGGQSATMEYNKNDFRFTTSKDKKSLYVYCLGLPDENSKIEIEHAFDINNTADSVKRISVVGSNKELEWSVNDNKLIVTTPNASDMDEISTVFKIEFM